MNKMTRISSVRVAVAAGALAALGALSGCVVAPAPIVSDAYGYPAGGVYAPSAPPAPYYEVQPAMPYAGAVWIGGYWDWRGNNYNWVPGRYERPRPGYHWRPHRWEPGPRGGWQRRDGGWSR